MYCRKCGAENQEGGKFCKICGEPLAGAAKDRKNAGGVSAAPAYEEENQRKRPNGKKYVLLGVLLAVLLAAAGAAAIILLPGEGAGGKWSKKQEVKRTPDADILLPVKEGNLAGYKNTEDEWVIQPQFEDASLFNDQDVAVADLEGKSCLIDRTGKVVRQLAREDAPTVFCALHSTQTGLIPIGWYDEEGYCVAGGFIDKEGAAKGRIYDNVEWLEEGTMRTRDYYLVESEGKFGYVDGENEEVIPLVYDSLGYIGKNGLIRAEVNGQWGWINEKNEIVIPFAYEETGAFHYGMAKVWQNERAGYINEKGEPVISCIYDNAGRFGKNGLAPVRQGEKWGYVNQKGEMVIPAQYDMAYSSGDEMLAKIGVNGRYGYIDKDNKNVIPAVYDFLGEIEENGWIKARSGYKCGYIDQKNLIVIPIEYDAMGSEWKDGLQAVIKGSTVGCINEENEMVYQTTAIQEIVRSLEVAYHVLTTDSEAFLLKTGKRIPQNIADEELEDVFLGQTLYEDLGIQEISVWGWDSVGDDEIDAGIWLDLEGNVLAMSSEVSIQAEYRK